MSQATPEGTRRYRERFDGKVAAEHFRQTRGLSLSSIGLGSYLGEPDDQTDSGYRQSVIRALSLGCNVFDTAANYRCTRSERSFGTAFTDAAAQYDREEFLVATKGGYLPFENGFPRTREGLSEYIDETFVRPGICNRADIVQDSHCMTPGYLRNQLDNSLRNLNLGCIDIYYIHNPETQLAVVSSDEFYGRLREAFIYLESEVNEGRISVYGLATWNGFRVDSGNREAISLMRVVEVAKQAAGDGHHFRAIQLPYNLAMTEALTLANQSHGGQQVSTLDAAQEMGITVMGSASMLQARLTTGLPDILDLAFPGLTTDAQRAIQFARSAPGLTSALVGMSQVGHVDENLSLARVRPASEEEYQRLFARG